MLKFAPFVFGMAIAIAGPAAASTTSPPTPISDVTITNNGVETTEDFSLNSTYEFSFVVPAGDNWTLDMAFGKAPGDEFQVWGTSPEGYSEINDYSADSSQGVVYGPGTWNVYVTLIAGSDPYGGFELNSLDLLPIPGTPLPSSLSIMLIGLFGFGLVAFTGRGRKTGAVAA